jgi:6-pyruvoyltetrahydropterin/6-carboxytetrahydropterin synthase
MRQRHGVAMPRLPHPAAIVRLTPVCAPATRPAMHEITQEFGFDAAHFLGVGPEQNRRMHGHSFYAEVTLRGEPDPATGVIRDLGEVKTVLAGIATSLDHRLLNEIEGLGAPTLENLACYIHARAKAKLPEVVRVKLRRPSYGQSCIFEEG